MRPGLRSQPGWQKKTGYNSDFMDVDVKDRLDEVLAQCWQMLGRGGVDGKDPFHTPTLVTLDVNGWPAARTVILREVIAAERVLVCHSDVRAAKVEQLQEQDRIVWHLWHPRRRVQLRLRGRATTHQDDAFADRQWQATSLSSRLNYSATVAPATHMDSAQAAQSAYTTHDQLSEVDSEAWRPHFCAIRSEIHDIEYLLLHRAGHRRAHFVWQEEMWQGDWLVP